MDGCRRQTVDILALQKSCHESGVLRKMGHHPQFNLE